LGRVLGESRFATTRLSPVSTGITARHWRALLFVGFAFSLESHGNSAVWPVSLNPSPIRVEANIFQRARFLETETRKPRQQNASAVESLISIRKQA
jgi:hypothetical protein